MVLFITFGNVLDVRYASCSSMVGLLTNHFSWVWDSFQVRRGRWVVSDYAGKKCSITSNRMLIFWDSSQDNYAECSASRPEIKDRHDRQTPNVRTGPGYISDGQSIHGMSKFRTLHYLGSIHNVRVLCIGMRHHAHLVDLSCALKLDNSKDKWFQESRNVNLFPTCIRTSNILLLGIQQRRELVQELHLFSRKRYRQLQETCSQGQRGKCHRT